MSETNGELSEAQEGMAKVGTMLAQVVEDALRPTLLPYRPGRVVGGHWVDEGNATGHDGYVLACEHIRLVVPEGGHLCCGAEPVVVDRKAYLCPMHPERLLCDAEDCMTRHFAERHGDDPFPPPCFECGEPVEADFVPVFAEITLHRNINVGIIDQAGATDLRMAYGGVLLTTPVAYLCCKHAGLVGVPIRMAWPTTFPVTVR